jgi:bzd-type benzoyl-CoA reductase N subunit
MIQQFREAFDKRYQKVIDEKADGKGAVGWMCNYVPEEIFHAAGYNPVRILGRQGETTMADAYLYTNMCTLVRSCLEEGFKKEFDFLDGMVAVNTCDHVRRFYDVWNRYIPTPFIHELFVPHKINQHSEKFFTEEVVQLKEKFEEFSGATIADDRLSQSIELFNKMRGLLRKISEMRKADPPPLSGVEFLEILLPSLVMPKEEYVDMLEGYVKELEGREPEEDDRLRIYLLGSELDTTEYIKVIEDVGGLVVADDLCTGAKYFLDDVEENGDPVAAIAKRYLRRAECPRMRPADTRLERIAETIEEYEIEAVVLEVIKFCNLYGEDYPILKKALDKLDVPVLLVNREYSMAGAGQIRTRVEAFFESIA